MYTYKNCSIKNPICIHFLCGCVYQKSNPNDKRNVLLNFINSIENNYGLILEKQFTTNQYEDMQFKDLEDVELMAAHYAKSIIILHETISTGAEIALFGSNKELAKKILVLHAPKKSTKINYITNFLQLAYFNKEKVIKKEYNFDTQLYYPFKNEKICYYKTFFSNGEISDNLKNEIINFWNKSTVNSSIDFGKKSLGFINNFYIINKENKSIRIFLNYYFILPFVVSVMLNENLYNSVKNVKSSVSQICSLLKEILLNTIEKNEIIDSKCFSSKIYMIDGKNTYLPVRFCLRILCAVNLLKIKSNAIIVTNKLKLNYNDYKMLLVENDFPSFFGDVLNEK